jgi:outer membrane protein assembly factor BamB
MVPRLSRREGIIAGSGAVVGIVGGVLGRTVLDRENAGTDDRSSRSVPLSWDDTEWPFPNYDPSGTRHPPAESAPDDELTVAWELEDETVFRNRWAPPVVANGVVFTAAGAPRGTTVWAIDIDSGDVVWKRESLGDGSAEPALAAPGGDLYYRIGEGKLPLGLFGGRTGGRVWGTPRPPRGGWCIARGRLYYGDRGDGTLHAYDARTGERLWTTAVDEERLVVRSSHPDAGLAATAHGRLYLLDPEDGSVRWEQPVSKHPESGPVFAGGRAFVTKWMDGMDLLAFDVEDGTRKWRYPLSPTEVENSSGGVSRRWYELGAATAERVVVRERHADPTPGALHGVDATSGDRLWRVTPPDGATAFSEPTIVGDSVYVTVAGDDGNALLQLHLDDGARRRVLARQADAGAPLVADGRLLVQTETGLRCLD